MRILILITLLPALLCCTRLDSITKFSEENKMEKQYYVYPSTLRMANLEQNEDFDELIEDFVKGQYFIFAKDSINEILIDQLETDMADEGYEEAMSYRAKNGNAIIFVQERKVPKIAAIHETDSTYNIVQIEGYVNIAKIPKLLQEFDNDKFLNVLDILKINPNSEHRGPHSQD